MATGWQTEAAHHTPRLAKSSKKVVDLEEAHDHARYAAVQRNNRSESIFASLASTEVY